MEYRSINKGSYQLHLIKTERFKSVTMRVNLRSELKKEDITKRNFLLDMLTYSTTTYKSRRDLVAKSQDLYAADVYTRAYRIGAHSSINFFLSYLNEKYTEKGMEEESIKLFADILFNPNVENKKFDSLSFDIVKKNIEASLKTIKDNQSRYSLIRMLENMSDKEPYCYREYGYIEDLEKITPENLYDYYQEMIKKSIVDIYIVGDFDFKVMEQLIDKYMVFDTLKKENNSYIIEHEKFRDKPQVIREKEHNNQSKLSIGYKIKTMDKRERNYVISLYSLILGNGGDSRLFKNIREKYSICYYISSSVNKLDNLLFVRSGINKENFSKCVELIEKEMKDIEKGNISDEELENAKMTYISLLNEIYDNEEAIIETYIAKNLLDIEDIEERKKIISTIEKDEIIKLSKKIKIDTIYLLEGDMDNE